MRTYPYFGTHDGMSASLIKYDLQNEHLEVRKINSTVDSYVIDIKITRMDSPCGFTPILVRRQYEYSIDKIKSIEEI